MTFLLNIWKTVLRAIYSPIISKLLAIVLRFIVRYNFQNANWICYNNIWYKYLCIKYRSVYVRMYCILLWLHYKDINIYTLARLYFGMNFQANMSVFYIFLIKNYNGTKVKFNYAVGYTVDYNRIIKITFYVGRKKVRCTLNVESRRISKGVM